MMRNNIAPAFVFFLAFGQLLLLPVSSELMQRDYHKFQIFPRTPEVQKK